MLGRHFQLIAIVTTCVFAGCVSDVSSLDQYRNFIGQPVYLSEPCVLWQNPSGWGSLAPYEIEVGMGTYTTHERVADIGTDVPLQVHAVKRRHYLLHGPEPHEDFLILDLSDPVGAGQIRAEVKAKKVNLR